MDAAFVEDVFARFGKVAVKPMFGGAGVYADDLMFALIHDDVIHIKTDETMKAALQEAGSAPFLYRARRDGRMTDMGYWRLPDSALDDPDEAAQWARRALAVAQAKKKPAKKKRAS